MIGKSLRFVTTFVFVLAGAFATAQLSAQPIPPEPTTRVIFVDTVSFGPKDFSNTGRWNSTCWALKPVQFPQLIAKGYEVHASLAGMGTQNGNLNFDIHVENQNNAGFMLGIGQGQLNIACGQSSVIVLYMVTRRT